MNKISHSRTFLLGLLSSLSLLLISCGGAGGVGSNGTGPVPPDAAPGTPAPNPTPPGTTPNPNLPAVAGTQIGSVTGFGSVIVEGNTYAEAGTNYLFEKDPSAPLTMTSDKIRLGMQTELSFTGASGAEQIQSVRVSPALIGTIESLTTNGLMVAGQTVRLLAFGKQVTVYEKFVSFAGLAVGNAVEVHGSFNAAEEIVASRIELLSTQASSETRVTGRVTAKQASTGGGIRLKVGNLNIDLTASSLISKAGVNGDSSTASTLASLTIGQKISAFAANPVASGVLQATALEIENASIGSDAPFRIGGVIREVLNSPLAFVVGKAQIDYSAATLLGGVVADIGAGRSVRAVGTVSGTSSTGLTLVKASEVKFISTDDDVKVVLQGSVTDFVDLTSFRVRNTTVDASSASATFAGGAASLLANDVLVTIEGSQFGNLVKATRVTFTAITDTRYRAFVGPIATYNAAIGSFAIQGVNATLLTGTRYKFNSGAGTPTVNDMSNGKNVTVRGSLQNGVFQVTEVEFVQLGQPPLVKTKGGAYELNLSVQTLKVNGYLVRWNSSTQIDGTPSNLNLAGYTVEVEGNLIAGEVIALKLKVVKP